MDIVHRIGIKAPAAQVYAALATIEGPRPAGGPETPRGQSRSPAATSPSASTPPAATTSAASAWTCSNRRRTTQVRWQVQDGPAEWLGTEIEFQLSQQDGQTIVMFGHRHWRDAGPGGEFMAHCSTKWATFLLSLRELVETGRGQPAPDDLKISNWH